jgi:alternate signal-mediated exported protein
MQDLKQDMTERAREWGADLVGVADTQRLAGIGTRPADLLDGWPRAVCVAVRLADGVVDQVTHGPTALYSQHYIRVNAVLDDIATRLAAWLQSRGGRALPLPASQILCEEAFVSYLSHKAVGIAAGLGWQGKSLLLVTPQHGPRVRLVTVITDLMIAPPPPNRRRCGASPAAAGAALLFPAKPSHRMTSVFPPSRKAAAEIRTKGSCFMKRKILLAAAAVTLVSMMIVGGTLAWFTDEQTANNIVTTGSVKIALHDYNEDIGDGDPINDFSPVDGIVPGEVVAKYVTVKNTGDNDAFVRVQIVPKWYKIVETPQAFQADESEVELTPEELLAAGIDDDSITLDTNGAFWTGPDADGYYYYNGGLTPLDSQEGILAPGEVAPTLLSSVTFSPDLGNAVQNLIVKIEVHAEAVQSANMGTATYQTVWDLLSIPG